jgi:hypothetical protein
VRRRRRILTLSGSMAHWSARRPQLTAMSSLPKVSIRSCLLRVSQSYLLRFILKLQYCNVCLDRCWTPYYVEMLVFKFVLEDEFGDKFFGNGALGYRVRMIDQWCGFANERCSLLFCCSSAIRCCTRGSTKCSSNI